MRPAGGAHFAVVIKWPARFTHFVFFNYYFFYFSWYPSSGVLRPIAQGSHDDTTPVLSNTKWIIFCTDLSAWNSLPPLIRDNEKTKQNYRPSSSTKFILSLGALYSGEDILAIVVLSKILKAMKPHWLVCCYLNKEGSHFAYVEQQLERTFFFSNLDASLEIDKKTWFSNHVRYWQAVSMRRFQEERSINNSFFFFKDSADFCFIKEYIEKYWYNNKHKYAHVGLSVISQTFRHQHGDPAALTGKARHKI